MSSDHPMAGLGDLNKFKMPELKEFLKTRGLPVSGKKSELVARLEEDIASFNGVGSSGDMNTSNESVEKSEVVDENVGNTENGGNFGNEEATPVMDSENAMERASEEVTGAAPESTPEVAQEDAPEAAPEVAPETASEITPEIAPESSEMPAPESEMAPEPVKKEEILRNEPENVQCVQK